MELSNFTAVGTNSIRIENDLFITFAKLLNSILEDPENRNLQYIDYKLFKDKFEELSENQRFELFEISLSEIQDLRDYIPKNTSRSGYNFELRLKQYINDVFSYINLYKMDDLKLKGHFYKSLDRFDYIGTINNKPLYIKDSDIELL